MININGIYSIMDFTYESNDYHSLYQLRYGFHIQKQIINNTHIKNQWILHMQTHVSSKMQSECILL
jgi:hypothetical protein